MPGSFGSGTGMSSRLSSDGIVAVAHGFVSAASQAASATRPPGRRTRRVSLSAAAGSAISM